MFLRCVLSLLAFITAVCLAFPVADLTTDDETIALADLPLNAASSGETTAKPATSLPEIEESAAQQPDGVSSSVSDAQHNKDNEAESLQPDRSGPEDSVGHDDEDESAQVQKAEAEFIETAGDDRSPETGVEARDEDEDDDEGGFTGELGESSENDGVLSREDAEDLVTDNDDSDQDNSRSDHSSEAPAVIGGEVEEDEGSRGDHHDSGESKDLSDPEAEPPVITGTDESTEGKAAEEQEEEEEKEQEKEEEKEEGGRSEAADEKTDEDQSEMEEADETEVKVEVEVVEGETGGGDRSAENSLSAGEDLEKEMKEEEEEEEKEEEGKAEEGEEEEEEEEASWPEAVEMNNEQSENKSSDTEITEHTDTPGDSSEATAVGQLDGSAPFTTDVPS